MYSLKFIKNEINLNKKYFQKSSLGIKITTSSESQA